MIESLKHKGLRQLFEEDNAKGVSAEHVRKLGIGVGTELHHLELRRALNADARL